jgi:hypothetical protein
LPHMKLSSLLHPDKYHLGPRTPGFYRIPWVRQGQHWVNGPFCGYKVKGASTAHWL